MEEAAEEFGAGQLHAFAFAVAAIAVVEGDGFVVEGIDALVGERGAVDVAGEILKEGVGA